MILQYTLIAQIARSAMPLELAAKTNSGAEWNRNARKSIVALQVGCPTAGWKGPG